MKSDEEVVDARSAAPQPVDALELIGERHQHGDEGHHRDVLLERRIAACDRNQAEREADDVGEAERDDASSGVRRRRRTRRAAGRIA